MSSVTCSLARWLTQIGIRIWPLGSWSYQGGKRDLRLDFLRGFAVCAMVVDHIGGEHSWLYAITGGDRFFLSVAEVFVGLSGFLMGVIYAGVMVQHGLGAALMKCLQRGWSLYLLTVTLTLSYAALMLQLGLWWLPEMTVNACLDFIVSVVTLHRTFYLVDIILLYTLLVLAAVPVLVLLAYGYTTFVLAGVWGLWALWQFAPQHAQFPWPIAHNHVFNFSAWQALFLTALVIGYHRQRLAPRLGRLSPHVILGLSGGVVAGIIALYAFDLVPVLTGNAVLVKQLFGKVDLRPGRLLVFVSFFSFAFTLLTVAWRPLCSALGWLLLSIGQNALTAYTLHLLVVALLGKAQPWLFGAAPVTAVQNTLLQMVGVVCIWATIRLLPAVATQCQAWRVRVTDLLMSRRKGFYTPEYSAHKRPLSL
jgi:hypothetical protein